MLQERRSRNPLRTLAVDSATACIPWCCEGPILRVSVSACQVFGLLYFTWEHGSKGEEPVSVICARHGVLDDGRALKNDFGDGVFGRFLSERRGGRSVLASHRAPVDLAFGGKVTARPPSARLQASSSRSVHVTDTASVERLAVSGFDGYATKLTSAGAATSCVARRRDPTVS